jgi:hypothetical protein
MNKRSRLKAPLLAGLLAIGFSLAKSAAAAEEAVKPRLNISIPEIKFSDIGKLTSDQITVPWIAEYVIGLQKFAVPVAVFLAVIMVILGGLQVAYAGGNAQASGAGKKKIGRAIAGLTIMLSATLILGLVSPELTSLKGINLNVVERVHLEEVDIGGPVTPPAEVIAKARSHARDIGGQGLECFVYASMVHESGGRANVVGHDENATSTAFSVSARRKFQNSGVFYSGKTFPPVGCSDSTCQNRGPLNDDVDTFDINNPPDYGLDWRFSHGFGSGQSTIFPNNQPCPGKEEFGRGFRSGSLCLTIPELMNVDKQIKVMVDHYRRCYRPADIAAGYVCYAGTIAKDNPIIVSRVNAYNACMGQ